VTNATTRALFENTSKKVQLVRLESSQGLLSLLKVVHPQIKQEDEDFAFSDGNLLLCVAFKMHSGVLQDAFRSLSRCIQVSFYVKVVNHIKSNRKH
jgi:hypothetical protein